MKTIYKTVKITYTKNGYYIPESAEYFDSLEAAKQYIRENY